MYVRKSSGDCMLEAGACCVAVSPQQHHMGQLDYLLQPLAEELVDPVRCARVGY